MVIFDNKDKLNKDDLDYWMKNFGVIAASCVLPSFLTSDSSPATTLSACTDAVLR